MKFKHSLVLLCMLLIVAACTREELAPPVASEMPDASRLVEAVKGIDPTTKTLEIGDAEAVAKLFRGRNATTRSLGSEILDMTTVSDDAGEPLMYIINFEGGGFTVISATTDYYPVLASNETGYFDYENMNPALSMWMSEAEGTVQFAKEYPDSLGNFDIEWLAYYAPMDAAEVVQTRAIDPAFGQLLMETLTAYSEAGYQFYVLGSYPSPSTIPGQLWNSIDDLIHPDYMDQVYYMYGNTVPSVTTTGPLIGSTWGQGGNYGSFASNGLAGCGPVAAGQIMYQHEHPTSYGDHTFSWNLMYDATPHAETRELLQVLGEEMDANYSTGSTGVTMSGALNAFHHMGYPTAEIIDFPFSMTTIGAQIDSGYPMYMAGWDDGGSGHAWVCEGVRSSVITGQVCLIYVPNTGPLRYAQYPSTPLVTSSSYHGEWYYNWGWNGNNNGWFSYANTEVGAYDFSVDRMAIINIIPNN
jgi:hypothetical protein